MFRTGDPLDDFTRLDRQQAADLERLPVCDYCKQPIQDEFLYDINGEFICEDCLDRFFKKETEDFVK